MIMPWINLYVESKASEYIQMKTMIYYIPHSLSNGKSSHHFSYSENNNKICVEQENLRSATGTLPSPTFDVANNNVHDYSLCISPTYNFNT
jgi:hypothetical protein